MNNKNVENNASPPRTLLIVEDDEALLHLIQKTLKKAGYPTEGALSGTDAIARIVDNPNTLVLLDYLLPDMTGKQVIETLAEQGCSVPFIIMTGHGDERVAVEMMKLGAQDYLVKDTEFLDLMPSRVNHVAEHLETEKRLVDAEEALKESEEKYRNLVENGNDGIIIIQDGLLKFVNSKTLEITGFLMEEAVGKSFIGFVSPEYRELVMDRYKKRISWEKVPNRYEIEILSKDGRNIPVEINASTIEYEGRPADMAIISDITERKQSEEALKDTKAFLDNIILSAPDAISTVDINDKITSFSPSAEAMFGYKAEDIVGEPVLKLYPKRQRKKRKRWKERLLREGHLDRIRTKQLRADGKTFDVSLSLGLLKDAEGRPIGIVGVSHDITEELKAERELKKAYSELKELDKLKSEFLQNVSHELRTPLTAMLATVRLLKDSIKDERMREILEVNERSTWRLNRLVGDLLDFGRIERDVKELKLETIDIKDLISDALADLQSYAADRQVAVKCMFEEDMPMAVVDRDSIYRVVSNLLDNAIKFNRQGGWVEVKASKKDGHLEVSIKDTGIGIEEKYQKKVFDRFYQVDGSTKRRYPGTGIGLALAKELIEMHGGSIWVESKLGEWSRFTFTQPYRMRG